MTRGKMSWFMQSLAVEPHHSSLAAADSKDDDAWLLDSWHQHSRSPWMVEAL